MPSVEPQTTEEAWEAAVIDPRGWFGPRVERRWPDRWRAWYQDMTPGSTRTVDRFAESEAAALHALSLTPESRNAT